MEQTTPFSRPVINLTPTRNMVKTVFLWPNGDRTEKTIDLCDRKQRIHFANLATKCYMMNGTVVCNGVNEKPLMLVERSA